MIAQTEDGYLETLRKTREAALANLASLPLSGKLQALANFHETAQALARDQFGGRDTAISLHHAILKEAAEQAAQHFEGMH